MQPLLFMIIFDPRGTKMNILVAEDERHIAQALKKNIESEGHEVYLAFDGEKALSLNSEINPDLILLDWRMPKLSGFQVCQELRKSGNPVPIILLTALDDISNKVDALNAGADDYITKPFSFEELLARINAIFRRSMSPQNQIIFANLSLDLIHHELTCAENKIKLPDMEFELLRYLLENKNSIVNKEQLCKDVWKLSFQPMTNFIEVTIKNLRKKLEDISGQKYIKSVYGEGYIFVID
jgi:DNA-binding response OmpR family regulator